MADANPVNSKPAEPAKKPTRRRRSSRKAPPVELSSGPIRNESGDLLPARYEVEHGGHKMIRRDQ